MNILQTEDMVKGLPDDRLMQEAKQPTGQVPQFLVVSEIQRRTDMRKRFAAQQDQPEGTVADQIIQGGLGSLQGPAGPPQGQPQGIPQQPQQMAAGGIVKLANGGGTGTYGSPNAYGNNAYIPTDIDIAEYAKLKSQGYSDEEAQSALQTGGAGMTPSGGALGINMPALPDSSLGPQDRSEGDFGNTDLGITALPESKGDKLWAAAKNRISGIAGGDLMGQNTEDVIGGVYNAGVENDWLPDPNKWREAHPTLAKFGDKVGEVAGNVSDVFTDMYKTSKGELVPTQELSQSYPYDGPVDAYESGGLDPFFSMFDDGLGGAGGETSGILDVAADKSPEVAAAMANQGGAVKGTDGTKTSALLDAGGAAIKGSRPIDLLMAQAGKTAGDFPDLSGMAGQRRKDAWSNAIVQLGAGIAGGDISKGLAKAGDVMAAGNRSAGDIELQNVLVKFKNEQSNIDRDTSIYGKAAQIQATADVMARELMRQDRMDRRSIFQTARMMTDSFIKTDMTMYNSPEEKAKAHRDYYNDNLSMLAGKFGLQLSEKDFEGTAGTAGLTKEQRYAKYGLK